MTPRLLAARQVDEAIARWLFDLDLQTRRLRVREHWRHVVVVDLGPNGRHLL